MKLKIKGLKFKRILSQYKEVNIKRLKRTSYFITMKRKRIVEIDFNNVSVKNYCFFFLSQMLYFQKISSFLGWNLFYPVYVYSNVNIELLIQKL